MELCILLVVPFLFFSLVRNLTQSRNLASVKPAEAAGCREVHSLDALSLDELFADLQRLSDTDEERLPSFYLFFLPAFYPAAL